MHFESEARKLLARGGTFDIRPLLLESAGSGAVTALELHAAPLAHFADVKDLCDLGNRKKLMYPVSQNFAAVDIVLPDFQGVANFATGTTHDLVLDPARVRGLREVVASLRWTTGVIPFYWIVPADRFAEFQGGPFRRGRRALTPTEVAADPLASRVRQYVLRIPPFWPGGGGK